MDALLDRLIKAFGVSGHESAVRNVIKEEVDKLNFSCKEDKMGNLIVRLGEYKNTKEKLMLCAHLDSIGVIINYIDDKGFVRVGSIGDFKPSNMVNNFVTFENGVVGRISSDKEKAGIDDLFIDLGAKSREEALKFIKEGNVAIFNGAVLEMGDRIIAPALDNRIGCYMLLALLKALRNKATEDSNFIDNLQKEYYFVFTSQNQLGARGARAAAYNIDPDYCIVVDLEGAFDYPSGDGNLSLEEGPGIKIMDRTLVVHHEAKEMLSEAAESSEIKVQYYVGTEGTDGATIHKERSGVKTGVLSVPCRYIHTNEEMVSMKDVEEAISILKNIVK